MSEFNTEQLIEHLRVKWKGANCPICKTGNWNVSDRIYELREHHGGGLVIGSGPIVPVVPVTCDHCGNTVLVNSIVAGLTEQKKGKAMSDAPEIKMSQDFELIQPKKKMAYPIPIEEWDHIKLKIKNISDNANLYHTIGSILLGVSGSAFVAALTINVPINANSEPNNTIIIAWFVFISAAVCGILSLHFGKSQRLVQNSNTEDVIEQMELIEKRYKIET